MNMTHQLESEEYCEVGTRRLKVTVWSVTVRGVILYWSTVHDELRQEVYMSPESPKPCEVRQAALNVCAHAPVAVERQSRW